MTPPGQRFHLIGADSSVRLGAFARDVGAGLTSQPKHLSCCYFYDSEGSQFFEEICALPEYYLPQAEEEILQAYAVAFVSDLSAPVTLVELGSGNAAKTRILIDALLQRQKTLRYVPVDICRTMLRESSLQLLKEYPDLEIFAVAGEYQEGMQHLPAAGSGAKLILWLGSNVGNFHRPEAARFLSRVRGTMAAGDRILAGIDLRKDRAILEKAYDDSRGVTAQFNLNLLARINRDLGGHFNLETFRHRAFYNDAIGRIEMYLDSLAEQHVAIDQLNLEVHFQAGEAIHTENSYKYSQQEIERLAAGAGLGIVHHWLDSGQRFSVNVFSPTNAADRVPAKMPPA